MGFTAKQLTQRFDRLKSDRGNFESMWQEISDHLIGRRQFTDKLTPGTKRTQRIFDTTAFESTELLSAALHSLLTNTESRWFGLSIEDPELGRHPDAARWLEQASERVRIEFNRPEANFTPQAHELYFDLVAFGTGGQFVLDRPGKGVMFSTRPLSETYISENVNGMVDTVFRQFEMTHRQAGELFQNPPRVAAKGIEEGKWEDTSEYLHVVIPNPDLVVGNEDASGMPWSSYYIDMKEKDFVANSTSGFWELPYQTPRWEKDSGEVYGRGPGVVALADARMLNEMSRTTLKAAQRAVDPPLFVPNDGILSNLRTQPGGISMYDPNVFGRQSGPPVFALPQTANIGLGVEMEERRARSIQRAFHHELLQLFEDPRMTATQVLELSRTAQRLLSPVLGRQRVEYLEPMIERVFGIMLRSGKLPEIPEVLSGQNIQIDYVSPVSRAQKADESNAVVRVLTQAIEASAVDPSIMDNFDLDQAFRFIAESQSVPSKILRDPRLVAQLRQQRAEAQAAQAQFEQMNEAGKTASRLLPGAAKAQQLAAEAA